MKKNSMRIVMITPVFPPYRAGMASVAFLYAQWAHDAGHDVEVHTPMYSGLDVGVFDFSVSYERPFFSWGNAAFIWKYSVNVEPDVIHLHYPCIGGMWGLFWLKRRYPSARLVVTYHMDLHAKGCKGLLFRVWRFFAQWFVSRCADVIHVTSDDYYQHSQLFACVGNDPRVVSVGLSVDRSFFEDDCKVHSGSGRFTALVVASLDRAHAFKGIYQVIEAIAQLNNIDVRIVGTGDMLSLYRAHAVSCGVSDRVLFVGGVDDKRLKQEYCNADVCLAPSTSGSEAFGLVLVEAQACGTPVIASDLPGVRTVFIDGVTGLCVEPGSVDSLVSALRQLTACSREELLDWGLAAREHARVYHPDLIRDIIVSLYSI